jgi:DNA-binding NarL/FixJ family response regulator
MQYLEVSSDVRVLLVEDSEVLRDRLREIIVQLPGVEFVGTADTEKTALDLSLELSPDVLILDLHLRKGTGFGVIRGLRKHGRSPEIIVLTNYALLQYKTLAQALGVRHFLDKAREFHAIATLLHDFADRRNASRSG